MFELNGKVALVTGANTGIGLETVITLAKQGADIIINYLHDEEKAEAALAKVKSYGVEAILIKADVSSMEQCKEMFEKIKEHFGKIDIVVNNAGITKDNLIIKMSEDDFDKVVNVNLKGVWNVCKIATKLMIKKRTGRIINMSSVVGFMGNAGQTNYATTKAGLIGLTKSLAKEVGIRNITVNAVAPGFIESLMTDVLGEDVKEYFKKNIPLGVLGKPEDIAKAVVFLASDEAKYITGQTIHVNGGLI